MKKSLFITFEGIEACGKSTQARLLTDRLINDGFQVTLTREPGGPPISEMIREILLDLNNFVMAPETELLLFMAARSQHTFECIKPCLENGMIVISDRYSDSTLAYQGAARKLDLDFIKKVNKFATYGLNPDLTFLLDLPIEYTIERVANKKKDRVELESYEFHKNVRDAFIALSKEEKRFILLDATKSITELSNKIYSIVNKTMR